MKITKLIFAALLLFSLPVHASPYKKTIKKWTRQDQVFRSSDFSARILWHATPLNSTVLAAQKKLYQEIYESSDVEAKNFIESIQQNGLGDALFFVSFYSGEKKFDDLKNPKAYWKVRLSIGDQTWDASHIEKISRISPLERRLYPHLIPWATGYYISFPVTPDRLEENFSISVYNPETSSTLNWK